jgi:hypothetical protein
VVAVWPYFARGRIGGLSCSPLQVFPALVSRELAVEFLNLGHEIGIKPSDFDASIPEAAFPAPTDGIVRIEHADDDACDSAFDDSFGARDLGITSPRRAWFQRCEEGRSRQRLVAEFAFKKRELGVVSGSEFASKGLAQHRTSPRNDGSDLRRNFPFFAHALSRKRDGTLHERTFPMWRGILGGHGPDGTGDSWPGAATARPGS